MFKHVIKLLPCSCGITILRVVVLLVSFCSFGFAEPPVMKKFYLENKIFIRIAGIALLLFVTAFIIFHDRYDLFRFPFDSGVWGTASDWMMVAVTFVTAMYLVRTFIEQKRANYISYSQHRRTIKPKFELIRLPFVKTRQNGYLKVTLRENELYNLNVSYISETFNKQGAKYFPKEMVPNTTLTFYIKDLNESRTGTRVCCTLTFDDNEGNKYIQRIELQIPGDFRITSPRFIKDRFN